MGKRTFASVTAEPCRCGSLEHKAEDPDTPIIYDEKLNEFRFEYPGSRYGCFIIYHCPFCGGAAPESLRDKLFTVVSSSEADRIFKLLNNIQSLDEAIRILGPPNQDDPRGLVIQRPEKDGKAPTVESFRCLTYKKLSDIADVHITEHPKKGVHISLRGKYIGPTADNNCV